MTHTSSSNGSSSEDHMPFGFKCFFIYPGSVSYTMYFATTIILMFPVCVLILYLGLRQWWQQRSTSTGATTRHSDVFIYHLVVMELFGVLGCILCCVGIQAKSSIFVVGYHFWNFPWYGEALFHVLTGVDRYLAVVHPIAYLSRRGEQGIRIRNMCITCAWLICFVGTSISSHEVVSIMANSIVLIIAMFVISFCSISVLYTLIHPGPGGKPGSRGTSNRSKMKAFYIVLLILGLVSFRVFGDVVWVVNYFTNKDNCVLLGLILWGNLPCTLVLPFLFLHRSRKCYMSNAS